MYWIENLKRAESEQGKLSRHHQWSVNRIHPYFLDTRQPTTRGSRSFMLYIWRLWNELLSTVFPRWNYMILFKKGRKYQHSYCCTVLWATVTFLKHSKFETLGNALREVVANYVTIYNILL